MHVYDAAVLGAGASGLMCAYTAARAGRSVILIDHADKAGRKLSITGGGRCNFTNRNVSPDCYVGENPQFCRSALAGFSPEDSVNLLLEAGIPFEEREQGQLFCQRPAGEFAGFLVRRCAAAGCAFAMGEKVLALAQTKRGRADRARFVVRTANNEIAARSVVIALGGPAWPQVGATGVGLELARGLGHRIRPIRPALVGLVMGEGWALSGLQGLSLPASVSLLATNEKSGAGGQRAKKNEKREGQGGLMAALSLSLLFTHRGLSGPAALQASLYWRKGVELSVDFLPSARMEELLNKTGAGKLLCRNLLKNHLPDRLAVALCPAEAAEVKCASLSKAMREKLHAAVHAFRVKPVGTEGFSRAEVAAGGVCTEEVSSRTMESRRVPGLFFCGEALDVTGRLGGYNLHWAFASGMAAGRALGQGGF